MGHRSTEWCPRCGTSLSQHELTQAGVYQDRADPSLFVRFPLLDRDGRVDRRLDDDAVDAAGERRRGRASRRGVRPARERRVGGREALPGRRVRRARRAAASSSASATAARSTTSPPGSQVEHRVIPWEDVTMDQGTGIVHIAPGCGGEDFELSTRARPRRCSRRSTSPAASTTTTAGCTGSRPRRPPTRSSAGSARPASSSRRASTRTPIRTAGAATRRSSSGSPTTGSSRSRRSGRSCSRRTRRCTGCPSTWASAWTTGCATWATGTSRAAATTACRCRSIRARAAT